MIFGKTKGENEKEDVREKDETNLEAGAFFEGVAELDGKVDVKEDVVAGVNDGHESTESGKLAGISGVADSYAVEDGKDDRNAEGVNPEIDTDNFAEDIDVVDWDDGLPACFAGFNEDLPPGNDK